MADTPFCECGQAQIIKNIVEICPQQNMEEE